MKECLLSWCVGLGVRRHRKELGKEEKGVILSKRDEYWGGRNTQDDKLRVWHQKITKNSYFSLDQCLENSSHRPQMWKEVEGSQGWGEPCLLFWSMGMVKAMETASEPDRLCSPRRRGWIGIFGTLGFSYKDVLPMSQTRNLGNCFKARVSQDSKNWLYSDGWD